MQMPRLHAGEPPSPRTGHSLNAFRKRLSTPPDGFLILFGGETATEVVTATAAQGAFFMGSAAELVIAAAARVSNRLVLPSPPNPTPF